MNLFKRGVLYIIRKTREKNTTYISDLKIKIKLYFDEKKAQNKLLNHMIKVLFQPHQKTTFGKNCHKGKITN